jgi:hypothetical protein
MPSEDIPADICWLRATISHLEASLIELAELLRETPVVTDRLLVSDKLEEAKADLEDCHKALVRAQKHAAGR